MVIETQIASDDGKQIAKNIYTGWLYIRTTNRLKWAHHRKSLEVIFPSALWITISGYTGPSRNCLICKTFSDQTKLRMAVIRIFMSRSKILSNWHGGNLDAKDKYTLHVFDKVKQLLSIMKKVCIMSILVGRRKVFAK